MLAGQVDYLGQEWREEGMRGLLHVAVTNWSRSGGRDMGMDDALHIKVVEVIERYYRRHTDL